MPVEVSESCWAELGLRAIGRVPRAGDLVAFRAEQKLLRFAAVGPETVMLEVVRAAPGDGPEIGTRVEKPLRDYLEAWGRGHVLGARRGRRDLQLRSAAGRLDHARSCGAGAASTSTGVLFWPAAHSARLPAIRGSGPRIVIAPFSGCAHSSAGGYCWAGTGGGRAAL
jgi:hypothetical protein